jgi:ceramide glucosyltransferase
MLELVFEILFGFAVALSFAANLYVLAAFISIRRFRQRAQPSRARSTPLPVTILKPVCGLDFELYENLRSFCDQDYPAYQVIFGLRNAEDPARAVIERLIAEFPGRDISLIVEPAIHGTNFKVSNLINLMPSARHDVVLVADSDMRVRPDYLAAVMKGFDDPRVGAVTCLYRGMARGGWLSQLACLHINDWFLPSVLVSGQLQEHRYCFGATMAIRRAILEAAGGFQTLSNVLADDYMIGQFAHEQGYRVELSPYVVDNVVHELSAAGLFAHELRWARTIRNLSPGGYQFMFLINTISVAIIALSINDLTLDIDPLEAGFIGLAVVLRLWLHRVVRLALDIPGTAPAWMIPLRDVMSFAVWVASFFGRGVEWRGRRFFAQSDGRLVAVKSPEVS